MSEGDINVNTPGTPGNPGTPGTPRTPGNPGTPKSADDAADETTAYRYDAFISYRHVDPDRKWAKWLHTTLETYRVPKQVLAQPDVRPLMKRCFRDEEELPVSSNLSDEIDQALVQSRFLIVICSPRTPESRWCCAEIERFRAMGRGDRILALLVEGEPHAAFPLPLRQIRRTITEADGSTREQIDEVEPLAADVRPSRTEPQRHLRRMAKLRLLACMLGVRFDDLRQREQHRQNRRKTIAVGVLAVLLGLMTTLAAVAVVQKQRAQVAERLAQQQRDRALAAEQLARQQRDVALETLNALVVEAYDKLRDRPGGRQLQDALLELALDRLKRVNLDIDQGEAAADRSAAVAMRRRAGLFLLAGRTGDARELLDRSRRLLEALRDEQGDAPAITRELAHTRHMLGELARRMDAGDIAAAQRHYRAALAMRQAVAQRLTDDPEAQAELAESHEYVGDARARLGKAGEALEHYQRSLELRRRIADAQGESARAHLDLATAHSKVGDAQLRLGDAAAAREHYRTSLALYERLAEADPYHTRARRDLAAALSKLGSTEMALADLDGALEHFERARRMLDDLARSDRGNLEWQRELAICHRNIGAVHIEAGRIDAALDSYRRSLELARDLAALKPEDADLQRSLAASHKAMGDVRRRQNDLAAARDHHEQLMRIRRRLAEAAGGDARARRDLALAHEARGDVDLLRRDLAAARQAYEAALAIRRDLAEADPANQSRARERSVAQLRLAKVVPPDHAVELIDRSIAIRRRLLEADPHNAQADLALATALHEKGGVLARGEDAAAAVEPLTEAVDRFAALAEANPQPPMQMRLATACAALLKLHRSRADADQVVRCQQLMVDAARRLAEASPEDPARREQWAGQLAQLGLDHRATGDSDAASRAFTSAVEILSQLERAGALSGSGRRLLNQLGQWLEAM